MKIFRPLEVMEDEGRMDLPVGVVVLLFRVSVIGEHRPNGAKEHMPSRATRTTSRPTVDEACPPHSA